MCSISDATVSYVSDNTLRWIKYKCEMQQVVLWLVCLFELLFIPTHVFILNLADVKKTLHIIFNSTGQPGLFNLILKRVNASGQNNFVRIGIPIINYFMWEAVLF